MPNKPPRYVICTPAVGGEMCIATEHIAAITHITGDDDTHVWLVGVSERFSVSDDYEDLVMRWRGDDGDQLPDVNDGDDYAQRFLKP